MARIRNLPCVLNHRILEVVVVCGTLAFTVAGLGQSPTTQPDWVRIDIELRNGRYFDADQLNRQIKSAFGGSSDPSWLKNRVLELTPAERAGLVLFAGSSWGRDRLRVDITIDRITLAIRRDAGPEGRRLRRELLNRLGLTPPEQAYRLILPDSWDPRQRTILLIHGLESSPQAFDQFAAAWTRLDWQVGFYTYPNDGPIARAGHVLSKRLGDVARLHPNARFVVIATSMGGLVARHCLETPGLDPGNVNDLVMLGTPNHGSLLAWGHPLFELFKAAVDRDISIGSTLFDGLGEAGEDLMPDSRFLRELNGRSRNPRVKYHLALGDQALFTPEEWNAVRQDIRRRLERQTDHSDRNELLKILDRLDEVQTGRGDGAVALSRGRLDGVKNTRVFHRWHLDIDRVDHPDRPNDDPVIEWILNFLEAEP